jgi:dissimilatory sulfite reductase related protein
MTIQAIGLKPHFATTEEGYLKDFKEWNEHWADAVAAEHQIELTDKHWAILNWLRKKQEEGVALTIRKVTNSGLVDIKQFYQLFPGGPLKVSSKIAGIPKPVSCI